VGKVVFPAYDSPYILGKVVSNQKVLISYDMRRMDRACPILEFCWNTFWGSSTCSTVAVSRGVAPEFSTIFTRSGTIYAKFRTFSSDGSCYADDGYGWFSRGYSFEVSRF
jgi:hypothetical protein